MSDKNIFGGGNPNSIYVPMSETEQEVLHRLKDNKDFKVIIKDWGYFENPPVIIGDLRLSFRLQVTFGAPKVWIPVHYFDLELRTQSGILLFKERQNTLIGGQPLMVGEGRYLDLVWDIGIQQIDPKIVKMVKPKEIGLTSRVGNMKLTSDERTVLNQLRENEAKVRDLTHQEAQQATNLSKGK